jgi:hypothetical protein
MNTRLQTKVKAVNTANRYANLIYPALHEFFKLYVGQKIEKQDGTLLKKIADTVPVIKIDDKIEDGYNISFMMFRNTSNYTISYTAKVCVSGHGECCYHSVSVYIGDMKCGVLENVKYEAPNHRTDYTSEEITGVRKQIQETKKVVSSLESKICEFGEYDR